MTSDLSSQGCYERLRRGGGPAAVKMWTLMASYDAEPRRGKNGVLPTKNSSGGPAGGGGAIPELGLVGPILCQAWRGLWRPIVATGTSFVPGVVRLMKAWSSHWQWRTERTWGSSGDWKEPRKKQPGFNACPVSGPWGLGRAACLGLEWARVADLREPGWALGKEERLLFWEVLRRLNPVKINHRRLGEVAVLTLCQSEQNMRPCWGAKMDSLRFNRKWGTEKWACGLSICRWLSRPSGVQP